jgi:hypothetical protein
VALVLLLSLQVLNPRRRKKKHRKRKRLIPGSNFLQCWLTLPCCIFVYWFCGGGDVYGVGGMELGLYHHHHRLILLQLVVAAATAIGATVVGAFVDMELVLTLSSLHGGCNNESSIDGNLIVGRDIIFISNVKGGPKRQTEIDQRSDAAT